MASGIKETDMERQIKLIVLIMTAKHIEGMSKKVGIKITVPSTGSIRI